MCDEPYIDKEDVKANLASVGIELPTLYKLGFAHNNCGGFCVRAGQGHFARLLEQKPELYAYHEDKEQQMREFLGKDVTILKKQINNERVNLSLMQLRQLRSDEIDMSDIGGCGCFVGDTND